MKQRLFIIMDSRGNQMFGGRPFHSINEAWTFLYELYQDEDDFSQFKIVQVSE